MKSNIRSSKKNTRKSHAEKSARNVNKLNCFANECMIDFKHIKIITYIGLVLVILF